MEDFAKSQGVREPQVGATGLQIHGISSAVSHTRLADLQTEKAARD
jgi:hypothetical protein